jgi:uncharacterized protein with PIN domain
MVIDTPALLAILLGDAGASGMVTAIAADPAGMAGAPNRVEAATVPLARKGPAAEIALAAPLQRLDISADTGYDKTSLY